MNLRTITWPRSPILSIEAAGAGDAGAAGGAGDAGAAGGAAAETPFYETFTNEAIKTSPSVQLFKTVEDLATGYVNLEKRFGIEPNRRLDLPADPKDTAAMEAVWNRLGRPEKPEGYALTVPALPANATEAQKAQHASDTALVTDYAATAHKLGLTAEQAKGAMTFLAEKAQADAAAQAEAFKAQAADGVAALKTEWGQAYEQRTKEVGNLLTKYGDPDLVKELDGDKLGNYPNLAKFIGKLIDRMAEPGTLPGAGNELATEGRALTPAQASAAARSIEAKPGFRDASHPEHKALVAERTRLLAMTEQKAA